MWIFLNACYGSNAPVVYYTSIPVFKDETVLATTGYTDASSVVAIASLANSDPGSPLSPAGILPSPAATQVLQASSTAVKFLVPSSFKTGVYNFKIKNSDGLWSKDTLLNVPSIYFIQGDMGDKATPGGWLEVHGAAVGLPGGKAKLALVKNGVVASYLKTDPADLQNDTYRQRFLIPSNMATGTYSVYVHNGYGGPFGWVKFSTFVRTPVATVTVASAPVWPQTKVTVAPPTGINDDNKIVAALGKVSAGGIVSLPAGTYKLSRAVVLPNHVFLSGAGRTSTVLEWVSDPMSNGKYLPLISGASTASGGHGTFSIKNLSIIATKTYNGNAIERTYTSEAGVLSNIFISLPTITGKNSTGIMLRQANNSIITNNQINARTGIFARENVNNLRVENNWLQWREISINLSGNSYNFIIANNKFELLGNSSSNDWFYNDNPGFWYRTAYGFPYFSGAYIENLYYAYNKSIHDASLTTPADYAVGITFDAAAGIYFGGVSSVGTSNNVTTMMLSAPTKIVKAPDGSSIAYNYAGGVVKVESGTGAGQWRYVVNATPNSKVVTIDQPFTVPLDGTSKISIVNMLGRAIFDSNDFGAEPTNQSYYFSMDVIKANNTYSSAFPQKNPYYGTIGGDLVWAGQHYNMPFTDWHYQFLNNTLTTGSSSFVTLTMSPPIPGLAGPAASYIVYRNNSVKKGAVSAIMLRSGGGLISDSIIEGNAVQYVGLGRASDPLHFSGIVLRHNTGASYNYGNLVGKNPGAVSGVTWLP